MKNKILQMIGLILIFSNFILAQNNQPTVWAVELKPNMTATVTGSLKDDGVELDDLSWAWNSSIACFPATQKNKFTGNHVFFSAELPPRSILTVTVKPNKSGTNLSIYGYQTVAGKIIMPEDLTSTVTCEADHKWDYPKKGKTQGDERTIKFNSTNNAYQIFIGIAGADGLKDGDFSVDLTLEQ